MKEVRGNTYVWRGVDYTTRRKYYKENNCKGEGNVEKCGV